VCVVPRRARHRDGTRAAESRSGARDVAAMRAAIGMLGKPELDDILQWYAAQPNETK
jgi:hypothetical protein